MNLVTEGKGYASELIEKAKKWLDTPEAKEILNMKYLNWYAMRENKASIALAKKSGFLKGTITKTIRIGGAVHTDVDITIMYRRW